MTEQAVNVEAKPQTESQPSQQSQPSSFAVPETYATKDWAKGIKTADDLWKLTDNAQSLIGKRPAGVPAPDAPDAEWDKFYAAAGRPEKADGYKLSDVEGLPEGLDLAPYKEKASSILHGAGLNQKQADKVWQMFIKAEMESANGNSAKITENQAAIDKEFDAVVKEHFGDKYDEVSKTALDFVNKHVPEGLRAAYSGISDNPKALAAMMAAMNAAHNEIEKVKKEYGVEGKITSGDQSAANNIDDVRKELAQLRTSKEAKDFLNPEHKKTMARIKELEPVVASYYNK
jgi:hypothetical protein